ncbi:Ferric enterobactin-binding periplasmic protein FepB [Klebsiella michiganensis]|uniref:Ferric enterobactin-binding periplasmic protein FepB n=1 Tax=Klebsiella michiganensis TaxID=1134687 RepID=A0A7H4N508_9ENTR|nr:Ferric enterobactin-binding periplasmic protein FepB [Klebsiella michiganensis]
MNFSTFCRRTLLASGLAIFGISSALAADWPRQITDSRGPHTLESQPLRIVFHQRDADRLAAGD